MGWFVNGRFRAPIYAHWLAAWIPQPRWLRRWYYRKSFEWWGHPSNHHWKYAAIQPCTHKTLLPGERDLWDGTYSELPVESEVAMSVYSVTISETIHEQRVYHVDGAKDPVEAAKIASERWLLRDEKPEILHMAVETREYSVTNLSKREPREVLVFDSNEIESEEGELDEEIDEEIDE